MYLSSALKLILATVAVATPAINAKNNNKRNLRRAAARKLSHSSSTSDDGPATCPCFTEADVASARSTTEKCNFYDTGFTEVVLANQDYFYLYTNPRNICQSGVGTINEVSENIHSTEAAACYRILQAACSTTTTPPTPSPTTPPTPSPTPSPTSKSTSPPTTPPTPSPTPEPTRNENCGNFRFEIDCTHTDDGGWERYSTTSPIKAEISSYSDGQLVEIETQQFVDLNGFCSSGKEVIYTLDRCDVNTLDLTIEGDSSWLIDSIKLYRDNTMVMEWGNENTGAWCMSTDQYDNQNHWGDFLVGGECYTNIKFDHNEVVTPTPLA